MKAGKVVAVSASRGHHFSKETRASIVLEKGLGVAGDAHRGACVQHRSRVARDPFQPNLRQVHLLHEELLDELAEDGFDLQAGAVGENILTRGIDLLALPTSARLRIGATAIIEITGLRNPCAQLDRYQDGLTRAVLDRDADGNLVRKAGVMGVVLEGGVIVPGDVIKITLPRKPHQPLAPV